MRRSGFLAALAGFAGLQAAAAAAGAGAEADAGPPLEEISVLGSRDPAPAAQPLEVESQLDEGDLAGYGQDTLGGLLSDIAADLGDDEEGPLVLVDGQQVNGIDEVSDLPPESVRSVQVLTRDAAARFGQPPGRRVVNVLLRPRFRQVNVYAGQAVATAGAGTSASASVGYTVTAGADRSTFTLRVRDVDPLFESDRPLGGVGAGGVPYDLQGNVVGWPGGRGEIDPALSALAGRVTTVAGVPPDAAAASLADFAARAGQANRGDFGRLRTLVGDSRTWSLNGTLARRLTPRTTATLNVTGSWVEGQSLLGPPAALLRLPAGSAASPFTRDVGVALYLPGALGNERDSGNLRTALALNHALGTWSLTLKGDYARSGSRAVTERWTGTPALQDALLAGLLDPFAPTALDPGDGLVEARSRSEAQAATLQAVLAGPAFETPAGAVTTALRIDGGRREVDTLSTFGVAPVRVDASRGERSGQLSVEWPLASRTREVLPMLGELRLTGAIGTGRTSGVGALDSLTWGVTWQPVKPLTLRATLARQQTAPQLEALTAPLETEPNVRFFDYRTNETTTVTYISGGNAALPTQRRRVATLAANVALSDPLRLNLNATYTNNRLEGSSAALPPLNAATEAAFAERFQRDELGRLLVVDSRPVILGGDLRDQLRWGISARKVIGQSAGGRGGEDGGGSRRGGPRGGGGGGGSGSGSAWRLNASLFHTWVFTAERRVRPGVPVIDLLQGGALGYGGGQPRHALQFNLGAAGHGVGAQLSGNWRAATGLRAGPTPSTTDLTFGAREVANLRLFAEAGSLWPEIEWAKGMRITFTADNLTDSRQRVTDGNGATPARYRRYLLDPLGRTVSLSLRKVF
jgi:iron complex outermembrane recepter protein